MFAVMAMYNQFNQFVPAFWHGDGLTLSYSFLRG